MIAVVAEADGLEKGVEGRAISTNRAMAVVTALVTERAKTRMIGDQVGRVEMSGVWERIREF